MRPARVVFGFLLLSAVGAAQQYVISTYAGGAAPLPAPAPGLEVAIGGALGIATDDTGSIYFVSWKLNSVLKLDPNGVLTRVTGNSRAGFSGDGGAATSASLHLRGDFPRAGLAVDCRRAWTGWPNCVSQPRKQPPGA